MKKILVAIFLILGLSPAKAEQLFPVPSTPDLAVTATATIDFVWTGVSGKYVDWIYIKNDCAQALWFDLRSRRAVAGVARQYPLKLLQNQSFAADLRVYTVGVSPANSQAACTFTMLGATRGR